MRAITRLCVEPRGAMGTLSSPGRFYGCEHAVDGPASIAAFSEGLGRIALMLRRRPQIAEQFDALAASSHDLWVEFHQTGGAP